MQRGLLVAATEPKKKGGQRVYMKVYEYLRDTS